jgi:hypothetical protein
VKRIAAAAIVLALAGCGGGTVARTKPKQPRLPRDLAQTWAQQSDAVASALASGDGCTAQQLAASLNSEFIAAVNERRVPARLQEELGAALNDLHSRISCTPPQPVDTGKKQREKHKEKHKKHGDEGGD